MKWRKSNFRTVNSFCLERAHLISVRENNDGRAILHLSFSIKTCYFSLVDLFVKKTRRNFEENLKCHAMMAMMI